MFRRAATVVAANGLGRSIRGEVNKLFQSDPLSPSDCLMAKDRKRPEDFLELVERAKRGRLKVYIGSAAGVGKTYQMLEEAHALKKRGVDVVLAFIETHDRLDTAALIEGLEVIPRQRVEYQGRSDGGDGSRCSS